MTQFQPCDKCDNGYIYVTNSSGERAVQRCKCYTDYLLKARLDMVLSRSGLSVDALIGTPDKGYFPIEEYQGRDAAGNLPKVKKYVERFADRFKGVHLYLWGDNGTQKSTVATWIMVQLGLRGYQVRTVLMTDLINLLMDENFDEEKEGRVKDLREADFLFIDDAFDAVRKQTLYKSGYQLSFIDTFLRMRLERTPRATIFTSNVPVGSIEDSFGKSIRTLIERNVHVLHFTDYVSAGQDPMDIFADNFEEEKGEREIKLWTPQQ